MELEHPPIEAHISKIDGTHYPVHVDAIPQLGDWIDLYSNIDHATGQPAAKPPAKELAIRCGRPSKPFEEDTVPGGIVLIIRETRV